MINTSITPNPSRSSKSRRGDLGIDFTSSTVDNTSNTDSLTLKRHQHVKTPQSVPCNQNPDVQEFRKEARMSIILESLKDSFKKIPSFFWYFYIEALLVPAYRDEWEKYKHWDPQIRVMTHKERSRKNRRKRIDAKKRQHLIDKYHFNTEEYKGHPHDHDSCTRVRINVSGKMFETQLRSLNRYSKTLLGDPERRLPFFDPIEQCYFFDRHRESFDMILYYYQSGGRIRRPYSVDTSVFYSELVFFDMGENVLAEFRESEGYLVEEDEAKLLPKNLFQRKIWLLLEYPESSTLATLVAINSVFTIILSIVAFCIATIPDFGLDHHDFDKYAEPGEQVVHDEENATDVHDIFNVIETICVLWFFVELFTRLISSPNKFHFCTDVMNIIDFVAIVPFFIQLLTSLSPSKQMAGGQSINQATYFSVLRVIRLVRVFRIFKLSRHSKGLQILGLTLKASLKELGLLIFFLFIGVVLFSSAIYFAEQDESSNKMSHFPSIPSAFYWGVVTMTTVGYGDMVPRTVLGKLIGTVTAVAGVLTIALPVPVIVSNFNFFYTRATEKKGIDGNAYAQEHVRMCPFLPGNGIHPDAPEGYDGTMPPESVLTNGQYDSGLFEKKKRKASAFKK